MGICAKSNQALQAVLGIRTTCPTLAAPLSRSWWERVIFSVPQREPAAGPGRLGESETSVYSEPEKSMHSLLKAIAALTQASAAVGSVMITAAALRHASIQLHEGPDET